MVDKWEEKNVPFYNNKSYGKISLINNMPSFVNIRDNKDLVLNIINSDFSVDNYDDVMIDRHFSGTFYFLLNHCQSSDSSEVFTVVNSGDGGTGPAANDAGCHHNIEFSLYNILDKKNIDNSFFTIFQSQQNEDPVPFAITAKPKSTNDSFKFSFAYINPSYNNNKIYFSNDFNSKGIPIREDISNYNPYGFISLAYTNARKAVILFYSNVTKGLMYTVQEDSDIK